MLVRISKLVLSSIYFIYLQIKYLICRFLGIKQKPFCITLYYHSIYQDEVKSFKWQMELLKRNFKVIKSDYFGELKSNKKHVILTFDDGFENLIENAVPILTEKNLPFTIFFITNYFGKKPGWQIPEYHSDKHQKIMTIDQMSSIPKDLLTVGSHTVNHNKLTDLNDEEINFELSESKIILEKLIGENVKTISFPNGEYNNSIVKKCFEIGYKRVFTIEPKFSLRSSNENISGRVWTNADDWHLEFWLKVHGGYCWLNSAFSLKHKIKDFF